MRTKFKAWAEPYINEHKEVSLSLEELSCKDDIYLEIGSGKGQFLLEMAKKYPLLFFLGVEKNVTCSGFMAKKLVENEITNAKMIWDDFARISSYFKDKSVTKLFLNFSDPWPKKRHHKRRLTADSFLKEYKRILKDDGLLIFKTDNLELFTDSLETLPLGGFEIISIDNDYDDSDPFDFPTEYEMAFRNDGVKINRLIAKKVL